MTSLLYQGRIHLPTPPVHRHSFIKITKTIGFIALELTTV